MEFINNKHDAIQLEKKTEREWSSHKVYPERQKKEEEKEIVKKQSTAIMASLVKKKYGKDMSPDTKMILEVEEAQACHGMEDTDVDQLSSKMITDMKDVGDQTEMESAMLGMDIDILTSTDMTTNFQHSIFPDSDKDITWGHVLNLFVVFLKIAERVMKDRPTAASLELMIKRLKEAVSPCADWICIENGWLSYKSSKTPISLQPVTDVLLHNGEPFLKVIHNIAHTNGHSCSHLIERIRMEFTKVHKCVPQISVCSSTTFKSLKDEVEHFTQFSNVVFVVFVSSRNKDREMTEIVDMLVGDERTLSKSKHPNLVIQVLTAGLKHKDLPQSFKGCEYLQAFPSIRTYKDSEVRDFLGALKGRFDQITQTSLKDVLKVHTEDQIEIKVTVKIQSRKITDGDRTNVTNTIRSQAKLLLEDPWTSLRQHLLHMFHIKNIRVDMPNEENFFIVEAVTHQIADIEKIIKNYNSRQLEGLFKEHIKTTNVNDKYEFFVDMNVNNTQKLIKKLKRVEFDKMGQNAQASADPATKKKLILGNLLKQMIEEEGKHKVYDLYCLLNQRQRDFNMTEITDNSGRNLLHMVVAASRPECFRAVFYLGVWDDLRLMVIDPDMDTQYGGYTPRGLAEKFLFKSKGPNTLEEYDYFDQLWLDMPLLHRACLRGNFSFVRTLVEQRHEINAQDCTGGRCILYACAVGSVNITNYLIEKGADPKAENRRGENGLILAAMFGKSATVHQLLERFDFSRDHLDSNKHRAIDYPVINGDIETLEAFIQGGVAPDEKLVSLAAKYSCKQILEVLVTKYQLGVNGKDDDGRSPFLNAAMKGNTDILKFLLDQGADMKDRDNQNRNCLHFVAESGHDDACDHLIEQAKLKSCLKDLLNDRDFYCGRERLMIVRGRDRGKKAWHYMAINRTLLHSFKKKMGTGQIDVKYYGEIKSSGFGQNPNQKCLEDTETQLISTLKDRNVDMTPLSLAAFKNNKTVAVKLLEAGAKTNTHDHFLNTALHYAAMRGNLELAKDLESHGADVGTQNNANKTPSDVAEDNEHTSVVNYISGKQLFRHANRFTEYIQACKKLLSEETMLELRTGGKDIRRHLISAVRELTIDINSTLVELGSGPVLEESLDSRNTNSGSSSVTAFAGLRVGSKDQTIINLPFAGHSSSSAVSITSTGGKRSMAGLEPDGSSNSPISTYQDQHKPP